MTGADGPGHFISIFNQDVRLGEAEAIRCFPRSSHRLPLLANDDFNSSKSAAAVKRRGGHAVWNSLPVRVQIGGKNPVQGGPGFGKARGSLPCLAIVPNGLGELSLLLQGPGELEVDPGVGRG